MLEKRPMAEPPPTYTRAEMDAILKRAIERQQARAEGIDHEDLVAAAGEVGIPREEVEAAARDLQAERNGGRDRSPSQAPAEGGDRTELEAPPAAHARAVRGLMRRAVTYFALSIFFGFIGQETHAQWVVWPVLAMTVSFVIQAARVFFADPREAQAKAQRRAQKDDARRDRREEKRMSRRERRRLGREERLADFERKVAIGADALVRVIDEARNAKGRLEKELRAGRERGPRVIVTPPPQGVRVDPREGDERDASAEADADRRGGRSGRA